MRTIECCLVQRSILGAEIRWIQVIFDSVISNDAIFLRTNVGMACLLLGLEQAFLRVLLAPWQKKSKATDVSFDNRFDLMTF